MATLIFPNLFFGDDADSCSEFGEDPEHFELKCIVPSGNITTKQYEFRDPELLHEDTSKIYRGELTCEGEEPRDVVCKLVYGKRRMKRVRREACFYANELQKLQGRMIPRFHGLFRGEMQDGDTVCLVLDYIGKPLTRCLFTMNFQFRFSVIQALVTIHSLGVKHGDFSENSIVVDENYRPYIIDFEWAEQHVCQKSMPIVFNAEEPEWKEFNCDELHDACTEAQAWLPRTVDYLRQKVPVKFAYSAKELVKHAPKSYSYEAAYRAALRVVHDLQEWYDERAFFDGCSSGDPLPHP
ncbi:hypothetical protein A0H81_05244 [Grifola frondosa]|uniref:Protein kinase domain-containing protein n=1 Tax=Grifola frondosa TaxID=5627 RepID=A0A1C7MEH9_GRIFR|nr:hypothetical protein A0H81_05244 [Grifola frondosa]